MILAERSLFAVGVARDHVTDFTVKDSAVHTASDETTTGIPINHRSLHERTGECDDIFDETQTWILDSVLDGRRCTRSDRHDKQFILATGPIQTEI